MIKTIAIALATLLVSGQAFAQSCNTFPVESAEQHDDLQQRPLGQHLPVEPKQQHDDVHLAAAAAAELHTEFHSCRAFKPRLRLLRP